MQFQHFYGLFVKMLLIENHGHLPMDAAHRIEVAVFGQRVGALHSVLVTAQSHRCLTHVVIGTPQQVVGGHPLVG